MEPAHGKALTGIKDIVKVLRVLVYPKQHSIIWNDVPMESPAIGADVVCKLHVYRDASDEEITRHSTYDESLMAAQMTAIRTAKPDECAIICRHIMGVYHMRRVVSPVTDYQAAEAEP